MKKQTVASLLALVVMLSISWATPTSAKTKTVTGPAKKAAAADQGPFTYTYTKPVNGVLKGVVELGSTGFNYFVINVDAQKNWELVKAEFGNSMVLEHMANEDDIRQGLKSYISSMIEGPGVPGKNIHFVISSGAVRDDKVQKIIAVLRKMKFFVNTVTPAQEGAYGLKAAMPKEFYANSFLVDMGSSNTKVAYMQSGKVVGLESLGSKYYETPTTDDDAYKQMMAIASKVPAGNRSKCFIIGGGPFELAKAVRKDKERLTTLNDPGSYDKLAADKGKKVKSAVNLYKAIQDATNCKQFIFDWDANFTIGFLLSLK